MQFSSLLKPFLPLKDFAQMLDSNKSRPESAFHHLLVEHHSTAFGSQSLSFFVSKAGRVISVVQPCGED